VSILTVIVGLLADCFPSIVYFYVKLILLSLNGFETKIKFFFKTFLKNYGINS